MSQDRLRELVEEGFTRYLAAHWNSPPYLDCRAVARAHSASLVERTRPLLRTSIEDIASISYVSSDDLNNSRPLLEVPIDMPAYVTKTALTAKLLCVNGKVAYTPALPTISYWSQYISLSQYRSKWSNMSETLGKRLESAGCKPASMRVLTHLLRACESAAADQVPGTTLSDKGVALIPDLERSYVYRRWDALGSDSVWHLQVDVRGPLEVEFYFPTVTTPHTFASEPRSSLRPIVSADETVSVVDVHRGTCCFNLLLHDEVYDSALRLFRKGEYRTLAEMGSRSPFSVQ